MREIKMKFRVVCLMMVLLGIGFSLADAASLRDRVLSDVSISRTEQHIVVNVAFNFPVRYLRHYPLDYGKEVNIQLDPVLAGIENAVGLNQRESLPPPENNPAGLVRVEYEGSDLIKPTVRIVLDQARNYEVRQGDDYRSLDILLPVKMADLQAEPAGNVPGEADTAAAVAEQPEMMPVQKQEDLLKKGAAAMAAEEYMRAILIYTELLDSADPAVRELAQFQLALAQDYKGHLAHARAEYRNYLNTYPEGGSVDQARARLKALMTDRSLEPGQSVEITGPAEGEWVHEYFGGISVYYERDESLYDNEDDIENLSSLLTGFDATLRSKSDRFVTEAVAIGSYELSFLDDRDNRTNVNRLYFDFKDSAEVITSRVGRQYTSRGGVLSRFDGGHIGYLVMDKVRVNVVAGFPVNLPYDGVETEKYFYGINFDLGRFGDHWDFNAYFINQISDDIDDRRAVGGEARFIAQKGSLYSLLDYDILYDELSVFLVTGNYLLPNDKTRINVLADFRGVPILSTTNALIGQVSPSLESLEETIGEDELRRLAEDRTLDSKFATLGLSHPITPYLQVAGDISWSKVDAAPASGGVEAFESTGDEFFYFLQLIGSSLISQGDISSAGIRYADTKYRDTYTFTVNTRYPMFDRFLLNPRFRIDYRENKIQTGEQWRFIPGLRLEYVLASNWRLEFDGEYRYADQELDGIADGEDGYWLTAGFRWDF